MFEGEKVHAALRTDAEASAAVRVPNNVLVAARTPKEQGAPAPRHPHVIDSKRVHASPELVARVTLIPPPNARALRVLFFLNCPYLSPQTPLTDPHYVGSVTFFGMHGVAITTGR